MLQNFEPAEAILKEGVRMGAFPGATLIVGNSERILHSGGFGDAQVDTIYDLASLTKVVVTTTLAMLLMEDGKLHLDEPWRDDITIRHLLLHTSGLPAHGRVQFADDVMRVPVASSPGARTEYCDFGFIALGRLIEQRYGERLDVIARKRIFEPLEMNDSTFNPDASLLNRIARTSNDDHGVVHDENAKTLGGIAGHAGLFSTARDLDHFCRMIVRGGQRLLRRDTISLFTTRLPGDGRALGWDGVAKTESSAGSRFSAGSFGHTGFTGTSIWIDPERSMYVILLTNRVFPDPKNFLIRDVRPKLHNAVMNGY